MKTLDKAPFCDPAEAGIIAAVFDVPAELVRSGFFKDIVASITANPSAELLEEARRRVHAHRGVPLSVGKGSHELERFCSRETARKIYRIFGKPVKHARSGLLREVLESADPFGVEHEKRAKSIALVNEGNGEKKSQ